jgi:SAM-dependent methyltransferase
MNSSPPAGQRPSYDAGQFAPLFAAEDRHAWFRARNRCIAAATRLIPNVDALGDIIEHGCGTGFVLRELKRLFPRANITGTDLFAEGLAMARQRFPGPLLQTDVLRCEFREAFDLIGFFDVLEHLDDAGQALRALRAQLRTGGSLLLTVPAHQVLWSDYDVAAGHRLRYSRRQLEARLVEAGFQVLYATEFMLPLFPLMLVRRRLLWGRARQQADETGALMHRELQINPVLNRLLEWALRPEPWFIKRRMRLPAGTSILALATKS